MIRTSKHNISNITNNGKLNIIDTFISDYKLCLDHYINLILTDVLPLKSMMSSKDLPTFNIEHSRYKQLIYKHASEIIRSQFRKASNKRYVKYKQIYKYFKEKHSNHSFVNKRFKDLVLNKIHLTKYFTKPNFTNISITLDERFNDIQDGVHFDNFIKIILPYFNEKKTRALNIKVPLKHHKHSNKFKDWNLRKSIQIKKVDNKTYINLFWEKEEPKIKSVGKRIGIDLGFKKLITTSDSQYVGTTDLECLYNKISNKLQGSKKFKRLLKHRDNQINYYVNQLDLIGINFIAIEDLLNVKHKSKLYKKVNNKLQRWSYRKTIEKLIRICQENGIQIVKVSPSYTSQTCSKCGFTDKESRNKEDFKCVNCGYEIDADLNASINILQRGVYSLSTEKDKIHDFI